MAQKQQERGYSAEQTADVDPERVRVERFIQLLRQNRANPKFNVLNAGVWSAYTGYVSNGVCDLEAYIGDVRKGLNKLNRLCRKSTQLQQAASILEKLEADWSNTMGCISFLRQIADQMERDISWYDEKMRREVQRIN